MHAKTWDNGGHVVIDDRQRVFDWIERGALAQRDFRQALSIAGVTPGRDEWRRFLMLLAIGTGAALLATGIVYFVAFNWHDMSRFAKFALVEAAIVAAVAACVVRGVDSIAGICALCAAAILTGALLALVGQTYQTGADTYELFAVWALAILPWALAGRQPVLWLMVLVIVNLATQAYFDDRHVFFFSTGDADIWMLFFLNAAALALWEGLRDAGVGGFSATWALRTVAVASGVAATFVGVFATIGTHEASGAFAAAWLAWLGAIVLAFRVRRIDVFVLAGAVLSVVVVVAALLGKHFIGSGMVVAPLLVAAAVVGIATGGGIWLKSLAQREP